jgi:hypothetical protein
MFDFTLATLRGTVRVLPPALRQFFRSADRRPAVAQGRRAAGGTEARLA